MLKKQAAKLMMVLFPLLVLAGNAAGQIPHNYQEDFTTFSYRDIVHTTAWWDVAAGELKMYPYVISVVDSLDMGNLARKIAIDGDYAYLANGGGGIEVIDISDPENISSAGTFSPVAFGSAYSLVIAGDYAYVADGSAGLTVVDISNPASPTLAGNCDTPGHAREIAVAGNYAYIADDDEGLSVIDISNPLLPVSAGHCSIPYDVVDVEIAGDYAYVSNYGLGLRVIDISDPTTPVEAAYINSDGVTFDIEADGNYLFMANGSAGLIVMDISDPENPALVGNCVTPGNAAGVFLVGDYAYVAEGSEGMQVISIADPENPVLLYGCNTTGLAQNVTVEGEYAYVADFAEGIKVIKIAGIISPLIAGSTIDEFNSEKIAISGDFGFVAAASEGMKVIDISDPANPWVAGSYITPEIAYGIDVSGNHAYVAIYTGLQVIDISDPASPTFEGSWTAPISCRNVVVSGDYAYVTSYSDGLHVIDISDPASPAYAGVWDMHHTLGEIVISGDYAYIANVESIQVLDISDPPLPLLIGGIDLTGDPCSPVKFITLSGNYLYTAGYHTDLSIINVSDPTNPVLEGNCAVTGSPAELIIAGDYCFADCTYFTVFDISDPSNPAPIDSFATDYKFESAALMGDYIIGGGWDFSITALKVFDRITVPGGGDRGQSSNVSTMPYDIVAVNLSSTQSDSITWEVCADEDSTWQAILNDGEWNPLSVTGSTLLWRSTLTPLLPGINPTCSYLEIDWLYNFAVMESIVDVPGDQGGWARIYFSPSGLDMPFEESFPIVGYNIHRRVDDPLLLHEINSKGTKISGNSTARLPADDGGIEPCISTAEGVRYMEIDGRVFLVSEPVIAEEPSVTMEPSAEAGNPVPAAPPGTWEIVQVVFAQQEDEYIALVPTLADSSSSFNYTVYFISAHTTTPSVFYSSRPDSGYSVDNIAPCTPSPFTGEQQYDPEGLLLSWDDNTEPDLACYDLYRGTRKDFTPDKYSHIASPCDNTYIDDSWSWEDGYWYKLAAIDIHGNVSEYALLGPDLITGDDPVPVPEATFLAQNYPNPFNPATTIAFGLKESEHVSLRIYDAAGRLMTVLIDEPRPAGQYATVWNGKDRNDNPAASGVYFYMLKAGPFEETRKMILLR